MQTPRRMKGKEMTQPTFGGTEPPEGESNPDECLRKGPRVSLGNAYIKRAGQKPQTCWRSTGFLQGSRRDKVFSAGTVVGSWLSAIKINARSLLALKADVGP